MAFKKAINRIKKQGFVKQQEGETFEEFLHKNNEKYWDELIEKYQNMSEEEFHEKLVEICWIKEDKNE